jgi:hypothetical protein
MPLWLHQSSVSSGITNAVLIGGCFALLSILPILLTEVYVYLNDIWNSVIKDTKGYQEWNRLRKEWNKQAALEYRWIYEKRWRYVTLTEDIVNDQQ